VKGHSGDPGQFLIRAIYIPDHALDVAFALGFGLAFTGLPIATGLAILRYRLFAIDVVIRLTLAYGTLSVLLAGMYFGLVLGAQMLLRALTGQTGQDSALIVATTLLLAGLFTPLRRGIQRGIDRRFYRSKYDSARTLAAFGASLRTETDLRALSERLVMAIHETIQPAHVSRWLSPPEQRMDHQQQPIMQWISRVAAPGEH
jgi:hypothetical protein